MKIYQKDPLGIEVPEGMGPLLIGLAIVLLIGLLFFFPGTLSSPLSAQLANNTLSLSGEDSTILQVHVTNPIQTSVNAITILIDTPGSTQLGIFPRDQTISILGPQETRTLDFLVVPIHTDAHPFLPGSYRIDVKTTFQGQPYQTSVFLTVEK